MKKNLLALALLAALSTTALAHDDRPPRYLAHEIPAVELEDPACLPGYATTQSASAMNLLVLPRWEMRAAITTRAWAPTGSPSSGKSRNRMPGRR